MAYNGQIVQFNNAGSWNAAIITAVNADSNVNILELTTVATSRTNVPLNETGAVSTCRKNFPQA
jgi:hypothetical protein